MSCDACGLYCVSFRKGGVLCVSSYEVELRKVGMLCSCSDFELRSRERRRSQDMVSDGINGDGDG